MRVALGCMRLSTEADRDDRRSNAVIHAALDAGVTTFDTARAYGLDERDAGHNERLLARAIVDRRSIRIVTKVGMLRSEDARGWRPDGRAKTIADQTRASVEALSPLEIDLLLLHAIDPRTAIATSVRALASAKNDGRARAIGVSNVTRTQLEEALAMAPIAAVEVALGAFDDASVRGGLLSLCAERGIEVLAHSPLGGPKRAARLARDPRLTELASSIASRPTPIELFLAYLLHVHPSIVPLVGARRVETATSMVRANALALDEATLLALDDRFPALGTFRRPKARTPTTHREVVVLMGIAGAGKSRLAEEYVARGHLRLNRDERGGSLREIARAVERHLEAGDDRIVVDNTYLSRASRNEIVAVAHRHGARLRCVHVDTPIHEAQVNVVRRMLARTGTLLDTDEVRPLVLHRMLRELEPPTADEGFDEVEIVPFARITPEGERVVAAAIALELARDADAVDDALARLPVDAPCLVFAWRPDASSEWRSDAESIAASLARRTGRSVDLGICSHPGGPPSCWCRPPLPGLWVEFAERRGLKSEGSILVGRTAAHATMARTLGLAPVALPTQK